MSLGEEESKRGYTRSSTESLRALLMLGTLEPQPPTPLEPPSEELKADSAAQAKPKKGKKKKKKNSKAPVALDKFLNATEEPQQLFDTNQSAGQGPEEDKKEPIDSAEMSFNSPDHVSGTQSHPQDQDPNHNQDHDPHPATLADGGDTEYGRAHKPGLDGDNNGSTPVLLSTTKC
jgi:hypothetical protein